MSNEQPTPPLWEVMHQVSMETADMDLPLEHCIAAELRAVADAIDTEWIDSSLTENGTVGMISDWLRAQADKAEAGE